MTTIDQELRHLLYTYDFLLDLLRPSKTPRVPSAIRQRARDLVKHYPYPVIIEERYAEAERGRNILHDLTFQVNHYTNPDGENQLKEQIELLIADWEARGERGGEAQ